mmetsp:Transcript_14833/g.17335  ORF Transcript_14833/g.17335 Transcript_14833/m.17335 type:complete len:545 (-) Transcript_14833:1932-3566(-)
MADLQKIYEEANAAYGQKRFADAIPLYKQILDAKPDLAAQINLNMGACYFQDGQLDNAVAAFDSAIAADATLAGAYINKGKVLERQEKFEEAADSYSNALKHDSTLKCSADIAHCYNQGKQYEKALQAAAEGLERDPDDYMKLRNERIFSFFKIQKPLDAVTDVEEILKLNMLGELRPEQIELYTNILNQKSNSLQEQSNFDEALKYLEIVDSGNRTPDSQYQIGLCNLRKGDDAAAVKHLGNAADSDPNNWKYQVALGTACMRPGVADFNKAADHLGKALENPETRQDPGTECSISFNLALALMRSERDDEALAPLETVYAKDKSNWIGAGLLGTVYVSEKQKEWEKAIPVLLHAIEASNGAADDSVYYNLGYAYLMLGMFKEAAEAFNKAAQLNPDNKQAADAFGRAQKAVEEEEAAAAAAAEAERVRLEQEAEAKRKAEEAAAAEKAAKDAAAKKAAQEERERIEREAKEAAEEAERQRQFKIAEARARRERRIKEMQVKLGPNRGGERLRRPSLDLIPKGNTSKGAFAYADWYNKTQATE